MTYNNYICLSCNKMLVLETWSPKSCDCGGVFVSRVAVEEAYGYLSGKQEPPSLNGAELARELVRIGAALKYTQPKATVTGAKAEIDGEGFLWLTFEFDHNEFGAQRNLLGKTDAHNPPAWLREFTSPSVTGPGIRIIYDRSAPEGPPDWLKDLDYDDDEGEVEEEKAPGVKDPCDDILPFRDIGIVRWVFLYAGCLVDNGEEEEEEVEEEEKTPCPIKGRWAPLWLLEWLGCEEEVDTRRLEAVAKASVEEWDPDSPDGQRGHFDPIEWDEDAPDELSDYKGC